MKELSKGAKFSGFSVKLKVKQGEFPTKVSDIRSKVAEELCLPGIRAKFFQNPGLMAALLNTGNRKLVESSYDNLWGTGIPLSDPSALDETQWKSIGLLGKMLMVIRSEKIAIVSGNGNVETEENMSLTSN